jgi:serine phosphatase RsbU (regulator of sigma subunit)
MVDLHSAPGTAAVSGPAIDWQSIAGPAFEPRRPALNVAPRETAELNEVRSRLLANQRLMATQRRVLARQREINSRLQRAIMPEPEPAIDVNGMRIAVRYQGADRSVQVGGDWYLADPLPGGDLLLAVGDVTGHGLAATATMAQLRYAITALAVAGHQPHEILSALNQLLCHQPTNAAATAVVARYHPDTRTLTWARAGHPPMVLANQGGVGSLWHPAGTMLGVYPDATYAHATFEVHSGDLLLMYTDGFVEDRHGGFDEGVRVLCDEARMALEAPVPDRPTAFVDRLRLRNPQDDACVLAAEPL